MKLEWKPELSVGIGEIDVHHRKIIAKTSEIAELIESKADTKKLLEDVQYLCAYIENHFETEEAFMSNYAYPSYTDHKLEHEAFGRRIEEMSDMLRTNINNDEELFRFGKEIYEWFLIHINETDKKMADFLRSRMSR